MRWALLAIASAVSLGAVVLAFNPAPHTGGDNAGYVTLAYALLTQGAYVELFDPAAAPHTKYPPVFPALLAMVVALGARSWAALKVVAAVSTVVAVGAAFLWAERRIGPLAALGVAVATALSAGVVYYSHWILSDPTFLAFTLLALWTLDRADEDGAGWGWLAAGVAFTGLAYFTRSAGLPLAVALLVWLALRKRWRGLAGAAAALGVPALLWWWRGRSVAEAQGAYASEFWLVDPYQPALGTVGFGGLLGRVATNAVGYVGTHLPAGVIGARGPTATLLGVALTGLGVAGWALMVRRGRVAELFVPLYTGLILLWPAVWSGDRFALPLLPLLFVYAAVALSRVARRLAPGLVRPVGAVGLLLLVLPALGSFVGAVQGSRGCARMVAVEGPFACYGPRYGRFVEAAVWAGENLPPGSAVMSRKPRLFYVMSGIPSRTFPFDPSAAVHLSEADGVGARYVLLDQVDNLAAAYVGGAIRSAPGAFCSIRGFGSGDGIGTQLLGVLPPDLRAGGGPEEDGSVRIGGCPTAYLREGARADGYAPSPRIPLLDSLEP